MIQRILVIGGTGMLGTPVVKKLLQAGFSVRILTRNKIGAESIKNLPVEIFEGDINRSADLSNALQNCQGVHINLSGEQEQRGVEQVVMAAKSKSIALVTYISGMSVCEENRWYAGTERKFQAEKAIIQSGIKYHIFRPDWFFESIPKFVANGRASYFGKQPTPVKFLAAEDYAEMVASAYQNLSLDSEVHPIEGPEVLTFQKALEMYVAKKHPEIKKVTPTPFWIGKVLAWLTKSSQLKEAVSFMEYFEKVATKNYGVKKSSVFKKPSTTLSAWLEKK